MPELSQAGQKVKDLISRKPRPQPAPPHEGAPGIAYVLTATPDEARAFELRAALEDIPVLDASHAGPSAFEVFLCGGFSRLKSRGPGALGRELDVIKDGEGGMAMLFHTERLFFRADPEQLFPSSHRSADDVQIEVQEGEAIDGRLTRVATLLVPGPPTIRYRLWLTTDAELQPFTRPALRLMLGCPDELQRAGIPAGRLVELGFPLRSEAFLLGRGADESPLMVAQVEHLQVRPCEADDFKVPDGFGDLRDTQKLAKDLSADGYPSPYSMRLSQLRSGISQRDLQPRTLKFMDAGWIPQPGPGPGLTDGRQTSSVNGANTDRINVPHCLPATFGALIAVATEQQLLDDVGFLVNQIFKRLDKFSGAGGTIVFDWLDQWNAWAGDPAAPIHDDGLRCLMLEEPPTQPRPGLLNQLAERQARAALANGTIGSQVPLPPGLLFEVVNVMGSKPPQDRFDALKPGSQQQLRDLYLNERLGKLTLAYDTSTSPTATFFDLINVQLSNLDFEIQFQHQQPLTVFQTYQDPSEGPDDMGGITLQLKLPYLRGIADIGRWPTGKYFVALGATGVACFFMPVLCGLGSELVAVGLFLLSDYAYVHVKFDNAQIDANLRWAADPTTNVLRPTVDSLNLDADVTVFYMSYIPTVVHQLVSFVYSLVGSHTDIVISAVEKQLKNSLEDLSRNTLDLWFPPSSDVPLAGFTPRSDADPMQFLYLEARTDAAASAVSPPYVTQVDPDVKDRLIALRSHFSFDRRYLGFVLSQNFLNLFINSRWKTGAFNFDLAPVDLEQVKTVLTSAMHGHPIEGRLMGHIWPAVSPRTVLTPRAQALNVSPVFGPKPGPYATTFFDDMRLCITCEGPQGGSLLELQFAAQAFTQIGFGGIDPASKTLDLGRFSDGFIDLYFDLDHVGVQLIHPEVQSLASQGAPLSAIGIRALPMLEPAMLIAMRATLASRNDKAVPASPDDPFTQRYPFPSASLDVHMLPFRGNLFGWLGLNGVENENLRKPNKGLLELFAGGALDIDNLLCGDAALILGKS